MPRRPAFLASTSTAHPQAYERHLASSSFGIHPSMSQDTFIYQRSLSSKSDAYTSSDTSISDSDSTLGSPSSVATNLSTAQSDTTVTFENMPHIIGTSNSSYQLAVQEASTLQVPIHLHRLDITPSGNADAAVTRPSSHPANRTTSRRSPISPESDSSGTETVVSDSISAERERLVRQRTTSLGTRTRDSRAIYPPAVSYLDGGGKHLDEWESSGVAISARTGSEVQSSGVRYAPNDIGGYPGTGDTGRGSHDRFETRDVHLPYPPGLEKYSKNLHIVPTGHTYSVPHRKRSDGVEQECSLLAPPARCVRWNENLICPSPILACQRRKGWFNRRGDQLWTNDGAYKPPAQGQEYPPDLDCYPEYNLGWQNEEGVRIDMQHRLIPKQPLRSALKQSRNRERTDGCVIRPLVI
ncbi:hypothetical protein PILCRDRAFT_776575 [Piloderma croceum F 1598]|uniref:Uncharacterized protein n=1 Tax=Piloderma croceum (strain F 1598) TaxID=765440 RepID=A0A0C3C7H4_PILCF|nr:hypothetical protein PILCRDRAFT_776575 [Piloderma croceum F 1598]